MAIKLDIRSLVYQRLQPFAKASGLQVFIADVASFSSWSSALNGKAKRLKLAQDEVDGLQDALEAYSCIALVKSNAYKGAPEVAAAFSKLGLTAGDVHYLRSTYDENQLASRIIGNGVPEGKAVFLYWFGIDIMDSDGTIVV